MNRISKDHMEQSISEMYDAINGMDGIVTDEEKQHALRDAQRVERDLRSQYAMQEKVRDAAPDILNALFDIIKWAKPKPDGTLAMAAIGKAESILSEFDLFSIKIHLSEIGSQRPNNYWVATLKEDISFDLTKHVNQAMVFKNKLTASRYFSSHEVDVEFPNKEIKKFKAEYVETLSDADDAWYNK